jgi:hypothetical protein
VNRDPWFLAALAANVLFLPLLLLAACSPATTETAVESGMKSGMVACEVLLQDKSIERTPEAEAWCWTVVHGCAVRPAP